MNRLQGIHFKASQLRKQQDALAAEVCELCGIDPNADTLERDWCNEVVYDGKEPDLLMQQLQSVGKDGFGK